MQILKSEWGKGKRKGMGGIKKMEETSPVLELPGFRFHPTEEELVNFYLRNILHGKKLRYDVIRFLNIYHHDPSELPELAGLGEREWYFFVPRDRKHGSGGRPNRTTEHGFWKATGSDRKILSLSNHKRVIGLRKTLVFYRGRAPRGNKTDWVMNEYRMPDHSSSPKDMVLCKIYKKATSLKVLEQRAALEEAIKISKQSSSSSSPSLSPPPVSPMDTTSSYTCPDGGTLLLTSGDNKAVLKQEEEEEEELAGGGNSGLSSSKLRLPFGRESLPEIQVPRVAVADWTQDSFWTQFNSSPWMSNLITTPYASTLNFLSN